MTDITILTKLDNRDNGQHLLAHKGWYERLLKRLNNSKNSNGTIYSHVGIDEKKIKIGQGILGDWPLQGDSHCYFFAAFEYRYSFISVYKMFQTPKNIINQEETKLATG